jgi:2-phosphosulfolactate phosphatase
MQFDKVSLETCDQATGVVVVIDVIRAFTTAAFAFAAGAETITLVSTVEEAFALRRQNPDHLIMGEVSGLRADGFDFGNSPAALEAVDLAGRHLVQRTSTGTQGVVRSTQAEQLLTSSFCCAQATVDCINGLAPEKVTFVIAGLRLDGYGDEDMACADYLEALLKGEKPDVAGFIRRVTGSTTSRRLFANLDKPRFRWEDIECCIDVDRFDFAMRVEQRDGLLIMKPFKQGTE